MYRQQDANECWSLLLKTLLPSLRDSIENLEGLFVSHLVSRLHCAASGEESFEAESVFSLKCHITQGVNHVLQGLLLGLKSELVKENAIYLKESWINGLPRYLTVHFVRFCWKSESNPRHKIFQNVDYELELDVYDLC